MRIGILTISDGVWQGTRIDTAGAWLADQAAASAAVCRQTVPDDASAIAEALQRWVDDGLEIILTTGGTGVAPRDVTPEATRQVIQKEVPGIAEILRQVSFGYTPLGMLSRGIAGVADATLIINLPGSPTALGQLYPVLQSIFFHAVDLLHGVTSHENP